MTKFFQNSALDARRAQENPDLREKNDFPHLTLPDATALAFYPQTSQSNGNQIQSIQQEEAVSAAKEALRWHELGEERRWRHNCDSGSCEYIPGEKLTTPDGKFTKYTFLRFEGFRSIFKEARGKNEKFFVTIPTEQGDTFSVWVWKGVNGQEQYNIKLTVTVRKSEPSPSYSYTPPIETD